jgi:hypothetical protein
MKSRCLSQIWRECRVLGKDDSDVINLNSNTKRKLVQIKYFTFVIFFMRPPDQVKIA